MNYADTVQHMHINHVRVIHSARACWSAQAGSDISICIYSESLVHWSLID
jgi:hypothetical protein